ncbi:MAG TPA: CopG family transcriptional regulator [Thermoplasmatales archaeon]|nr:CopG family transcriptional regulator [Thermoplasmata archaeon]RLF49648.1 MAG: CopG family transcriptional regulator [Thermoplasmata archaeon]HDH81752.1 CopG family transcriptional regulator [Thermoplasmatales archaeon]
MEYTTISAKIPKELREKMKEYGIKSSDVIRKAVYMEVKKNEMKKIKERMKSVKSIISKISTEDVVESIREDREK